MSIFYNIFKKSVTQKIWSILLLLIFIVSANAQIERTDWQMNTVKARNQTNLKGIPANALNVTVSISDFKQKLKYQKQEITLPNPDGEFETFVIEPTNIVAKEVAHLYTIKTFRGYKKDDPTVLLSADISDNGFHAGVFTAGHSYFIEPISNQPNQTNRLAIYYKRDVKGEKLKCHVDYTNKRQVQPTPAQKRYRAVAKRTFRLAVVATGEYGQQFGGTPFSATNTLNAMASGVNMMNVVYLRDLGIEFTLVSTASMVFGDPDTDNIDVEDGEDISEKTYDIITDAIGENGYDVGHMVIWANLGGAAAPGVVCNDFDKSDGYSGADGSVVTLWVDYVAHEIGHQFNADHNFVSEECGTSVDGFRYEPGEGSSIMSYADVCGGAAQYASGSDPYFHYASIETMLEFLATIDCGTTEPNGNSSDPVPNAQSDIIIPKQTPFVLVGSATDVNDPIGNLSYSWEQYDGSSEAVSGPPNCNSTNAPLFRYRPPNNTGIRSFPQYTDVVAENNNSMDWEKLPCTARDINFSLTVRDNNPTFGRVAQDLMKITVANTGPFEVSTPNGGESVTGNTTATVTWTVNGTDAHCSNVDILLSTDGGTTFTVIANATPNDSTEEVTIPNTASTTARILIQCDVAGSYGSVSTFYDISNSNFTIEEGMGSGCTDDLVEADFDDPITSGNYEAANTITADNKLADASNVNFYAGTSITLKPGFEVASGAQFLARIRACASSISADTIDAYKINAPTETQNNLVQEELGLRVAIFPNPANDQLNVVSQSNNLVKYRLIGLDGVVFSQGGLQSSTQIEVSHLPKGMYFLFFLDENTGDKVTKKVVINQ